MGVGQKEVLWNTAENIGIPDLNNMQRFLRAVMMNWNLGQAGSFQGVGSGGAADFNRYKALYCLGDSCAPYPINAANTIDSLGGPILQWKTGLTFPLSGNAPPSDWGGDAYALVYWASPSELQTVHAVGDATNPRWDLVCIRLDDVSNDVSDEETRLQKQVVGSSFVISSDDFIKRRKVTLTKQIVQGTPAASPAIPAVPSGFLPYYAVKILATQNAAFAYGPPLFTLPPEFDDFHDYRMPLGSFVVEVNAGSVVARRNAFATFTAIGTLGSVLFPNTATLDMIPELPVQPSSCRLLAVQGLSGEHTELFTVDLGCYNPIVNGTFSSMGGNATWVFPNLGTATSGGGAGDYILFTQTLAGSAGNDPPTAAIKPPWGTGRPSGYASRPERGAPARDLYERIGLRYRTTGASLPNTTLMLARFHFAGMPY